MERARVNPDGFNQDLKLPYALKLEAFAIAMDDIYEMLFKTGSRTTKRTCRPKS